MASPKSEVVFSAPAKNALDKLNQQDKGKVLKAADRMKEAPTAGAAVLKGTQSRLWKKRLGDVRIIFSYDQKARKVLIVAVEMRQKDTYDDIGSWLKVAERADGK